VDRIARALGVTRIARVTGLDRAGIEVACAIRPGGHVLQVTNGKGRTFAQAARGALSEAAELWAAERFDPAECVFGSLRELPDAWDAADLGSGGELVAPRLWSEQTRIAWRPARELFSGEQVLVPAQAVHCPPPGGAQLGPAVVRWSTNGMGAHRTRALALRHALHEAAERDQVHQALPEGWTLEAMRERKLSEVRALGPGLEAHFFDLGGRLGLPVAAALLLDREEGPVPVAAGYACGDDALLRALQEAAQSRLTDIHGAREDVTPMDREAAAGLRDACLSLRGKRARLSGRPGTEVLKSLWRAGYRRAAEVVLLRAPLWVIKVIVPGLAISELL
jgi:ribosomal protein S12 methylthiotransferase accessory factor